MKAIELVADVDAQRRIQIMLPPDISADRVRVLVLAPEAGDDAAGALWMQGIAREWMAELNDPREDIYTLEDGEPVDAAR